MTTPEELRERIALLREFVAGDPKDGAACSNCVGLNLTHKAHYRVDAALLDWAADEIEVRDRALSEIAHQYMGLSAGELAEYKESLDEYLGYELASYIDAARAALANEKEAADAEADSPAG